jgi:hypothetical protein
VLVNSTALGVACGDDTQSSGDSESSESSTTSSDGGIVDDSSSSSDSDSSGTPDPTTGDPDTTGGSGEPGEDVRVYYEVRSQPDAPVLEAVDLVDGVATDPLELVTFAGPRHLSLVGDRWLAATSAEVMPGVTAELAAYDLQAQPPTMWPIEVPAQAVSAHMVARDPTGARWLFSTGSSGEFDLYVVELGDDGPGPLWPVDVDGGIDVDVLDSPGFVRGGESVVIRDGLGDGSSGIWLGPADELAPPLVLLVDGPIVNAYPDPPGTGLFVMQDAGGVYLDLRDEVPGAPQPLVLLPGPSELGWPAFAPDGGGLALVQQGREGPSNVAWIEIEDGVAMPAVQLSTGASADVADFVGGYSPDGRWLTFSGESQELFVVDFGDGTPGPATSIIADESVASLASTFAPDSQSLYYRGETAEGTRLRRVALGGDVPAAPESLSDPLFSIVYIFVAADSQSIYFSGVESAGEPIEAWWVDVSRDTPAAPVRINEDLPQYDSVSSGDLTPNGSHALLSIQYAAKFAHAEVVDLSSGFRLPLAGGAPIGFATMRALR